MRVTQRGKPCSYTVAPLSLSFDQNGGSAQVDIDGDPSDCAWQASTQQDWLSLSASSGEGDAAIEITATPNPSAETREGTVSVAGKTVSVSQAANLTQNEAPVANAGPDQTATEGDVVGLDGSGSSDPDGQIVSYGWIQTGGTQVTLVDANAAAAGFTAPTPAGSSEDLSFSLTVTDNEGAQSTDATVVTVEALAPAAPQPHAGEDQQVAEGDTVTLSASLVARSGVAFAWTQLEGPGVTLSAPQSAKTTFVTPPVEAGGQTTLRFQVTATDELEQQGADEVTVTVTDNGVTGYPAEALPLQVIGGQRTAAFELSGGAFVALHSREFAQTPLRDESFEGSDWEMWEMLLQTDQPGGSVDMTVYLDEAADDGLDWFNYGEPLGWRDLDAVFAETRTSLTVTLTDGGAGDRDGEANGVIDHLGALGQMVEDEEPTTDSGGGSGGGGCLLDARSNDVGLLVLLALAGLVALRRQRV